MGIFFLNIGICRRTPLFLFNGKRRSPCVLKRKIGRGYYFGGYWGLSGVIAPPFYDGRFGSTTAAPVFPLLSGEGPKPRDNYTKTPFYFFLILNFLFIFSSTNFLSAKNPNQRASFFSVSDANDISALANKANASSSIPNQDRFMALI